MSIETEEIRTRYESRKQDPAVSNRYRKYYHYYYHLRAEREHKYLGIFLKKFDNLGSLQLLEIGAGAGDNILFFNRLGIDWKNLWANELLKDRGEGLKQRFPQSTVEVGDAMQLNYRDKFDVVLVATVFSSILDKDFKIKLANKSFEMLKPGGFILWYDFTYNNPNNPDVKGVPKSEIKELFSSSTSIEFHRVTLAPPIGKVVGRLYPLVNMLFPFLRTHVVGVIRKG